MPECPTDFILYDNSMWNVPFETTWQESKYITHPFIPNNNFLNDDDDDNDGSESKGSSKAYVEVSKC